MNIIKAFASGKPVRRKGKTFSYDSSDGYSYYPTTHIHPDTFIDPQFLLSVVHLTEQDILANDWQVKKDE